MISPILDPPKCPRCEREVNKVVRDTLKFTYFYCHYSDCPNETVKQEKKA